MTTNPLQVEAASAFVRAEVAHRSAYRAYRRWVAEHGIAPPRDDAPVLLALCRRFHSTRRTVKLARRELLAAQAGGRR